MQPVNALRVSHFVELRQATAADVHGTIALWHKTEFLNVSPCLRSAEGFAQFLAENSGVSYVAVNACGVIVGSLMCHIARQDKIAHLKHVAIDEAFRGQGIATQLYICTLAALKNHNVSQISLIAQGANAVGLRFWSRLGFDIQGCVPGNPAKLVLTKQLGDAPSGNLTYKSIYRAHAL